MNPFCVCPICRCVVQEPGAVCHRCQSKVESALVVRVCGWLLVLCFVIAAISARSCKGASVVTDEFLDRVAWRESRNNPNAVGRKGELSAYQLRPCAVQHVNQAYGWRFSFKAATRDHAKAYARAYMMICEREMMRRLKRQPTQTEVYAAYNRGPFCRN